MQSIAGNTSFSTVCMLYTHSTPPPTLMLQGLKHQLLMALLWGQATQMALEVLAPQHPVHGCAAAAVADMPAAAPCRMPTDCFALLWLCRDVRLVNISIKLTNARKPISLLGVVVSGH